MQTRVAISSQRFTLYPMAEDAVLIATGTDKPGVMDELSEFLLQCGANIIESRSVNLQGHFALLLLVRAEPAAMAAVRAGLVRFEAPDMAAKLQPPQAVSQSSAVYPYQFRATGDDQVGVLHRISHLLRALNINIENVETHVYPDKSFQICLRLAIPRETPVKMLREYLSYLCAELKIKGELTEL